MMTFSSKMFLKTIFSHSNIIFPRFIKSREKWGKYGREKERNENENFKNEKSNLLNWIFCDRDRKKKEISGKIKEQQEEAKRENFQLSSLPTIYIISWSSSSCSFLRYFPTFNLFIVLDDDDSPCWRRCWMLTMTMSRRRKNTFLCAKNYVIVELSSNLFI